MIRWEYSDTRNSRCGTMICGKCNKPITEGRYRSRQKLKGGDWGYSNQHEACSMDDPEWARIDREAAKYSEERRLFVAACVDFKSKWGRHLSGELDEYIPEAAT